MTLYLPDSDAVIDYLRGFPSTMAFLDGLAAGGDVLCTCSVVIGEVYSGLRPADLARGERTLARLRFLPASRASGRCAGEWRFAFARQGITLAMTDCLIAGTAYVHGAQIITANIRDYPTPDVTVVPLPRARR